MKSGPLACAVLGMLCSPVMAQGHSVYSAYSSAGTGAAAPSGGSSVAYGQPLYYIERLRPSRHYPPSPYGYVEVSGRSMQGGVVRTPGR